MSLARTYLDLFRRNLEIEPIYDEATEEPTFGVSVDGVDVEGHRVLPGAIGA